ncbi:hypothetical protein [Nonomuraea sp. NPDC049784]|uniref:hypothetical protein n=1 Tax=Nonomuraea sp. NPDC049784 TaxID=3154361 RepID=UPI0033FCB9BE
METKDLPETFFYNLDTPGHIDAAMAHIQEAVIHRTAIDMYMVEHGRICPPFVPRRAAKHWVNVRYGSGWRLEVVTDDGVPITYAREVEIVFLP